MNKLVEKIKHVLKSLLSNIVKDVTYDIKAIYSTKDLMSKLAKLDYELNEEEIRQIKQLLRDYELHNLADKFSKNSENEMIRGIIIGIISYLEFEKSESKTDKFLKSVIKKYIIQNNNTNTNTNSNLNGGGSTKNRQIRKSRKKKTSY